MEVFTIIFSSVVQEGQSDFLYL